MKANLVKPASHLDTGARRKTLPGRGCLGLARSLVLAGLVSGRATLAEESLLLAAPNASALRADAPANALRSRPVLVNSVAIEELASPGSHRLTLATFDGTTYMAILNRREDFGTGRFVWLGEIEGESPSSVVLSVYDGSFALTVRSIQGDFFRLRTRPDGTRWLDEIDPKTMGHCGNEDAAAGPIPSVLKGGPPPPGPGPSGGAWIDLLAFHTPQARVAAGGYGSIRASILSSIASANDAHRNSGTHTRWRLVDIQEVSGYVESADIGTELTRLETTNDGYLDEIHPIRDALGADVVHLFVNVQGTSTQPGVIGIADLAGNFGVTKWDAGNGLVFAHETGHNLGCRHQPANDPAGTYQHALEAAHDWYDPIFGTYMFTSRAETVMWASANSTVIAHFSDLSSSVTFSFLSQQVTLPLGDAATADNSRFIRENRMTLVTARDPLFYASPYASSSGEATPISPVNSVQTIFDTWYLNAVANPANVSQVNLLAGNYNEAVRITAKCRLQSWVGGTARIGTP